MPWPSAFAAPPAWACCASTTTVQPVGYTTGIAELHPLGRWAEADTHLIGAQCLAVGGEHAAPHLNPQGLQVAGQLERLDYAKALLDLTGGLVDAPIRIVHQGLELPVVLLQQGIDHGNDGQDQEPRDQKDLPVGEHKAQGRQAQQGAAAGGASVVLLGHRQATLRWRFRHCPQHQSGALPAPLLEEPTMRNSHE